MKKDKKNNQKPPSEKVRTIEALATYIFGIFIALAVTFLFSGTAGILITTALICALVLSLSLTLLIRKYITVEFKTDKTTAAKGDTIFCEVLLQKSIFLPSPIIEVAFDSSAHLTREKDLLRATLAEKESSSFRLPFTARHCGESRIIIKGAYVSDFLGIFRFPIKSCEKGKTLHISVYPDIPEVPVQTEFLKTAARFAENDDDEEETNETSQNSTGLPGYDHREYIPGDPIKRINWKLSSKREIYMIRLDEQIAGAGQLFFLDLPQIEENEETLSIRDNVIEGMLAVFSMLMRENREIIFLYAKNGVWERFDIRAAADVYTLQEELSQLSPCSVSDVMPSEVEAIGKTPICFTCAAGFSPQSAAEIASQNPAALIISAEKAALPRIAAEMWTISEDFEIKKQN